MTDRELLELAAKAAEVPLARLSEYTTCGKVWNPLTDDGDALRLAVNLGISLLLDEVDCAVSDAGAGYVKQFTEPNGDDDCAAARRAIVRAAAYLGQR